MTISVKAKFGCRIMKILLVGQNCVSKKDGKIVIPGGTERYIYGLAKQLQIDNYDVKVLASTFDRNEVGVHNLEGIDTYRFYVPFKFNRYIADTSTFYYTLKFVKKFNPDIVHVITPRYRFSVGAVAAAKIANIKTVYTRTTLPHNENRKKIPIFVDNFLSTNILKFADVTISLSNEMREIMGNCGKKIEMIPSFITRSYSSNVEKCPNHILYVGRLDRFKGIEDLIESLSYVKEDVPNIKLSIVGKGEYLNDFRSLVSDKNLNENVIFEGYLYDDELISVYSRSEAFIFPSYREGMPMAVIEAMSAGLPIIASNIEPCIELLEDGKCGILVKKGDKKDLADQIVRLVKDDVLKAHYAKMSLEKSKYYSQERVVRQIEDIYESLSDQNQIRGKIS